MANQDNNGDVPDPYYGSDNGFEKVQLLLDEAIRRLIPLLTSS
jgi:protein-tyrosine-phosphatase